MEEYGQFIERVELIEGAGASRADSNMLLQDRYLIKDNLRDLLYNAWKVRSSRLINPTDNDGFYMVVFNVFNSKNKSTLVYNAVKYNYVFLECFLIYVLIEQMSTSIYNITPESDVFFCVDTKLKCFDMLLSKGIDKFYNVKIDVNLNHLLSTTLKPINYTETLKIKYSWQVPFMSLEDMSEIIFNLYHNRKEDLINKLDICCNLECNDKVPYYISMYLKRFKFKPKMNIVYNYMFKFVFIVSDLDLLLNNLKKVGFEGVNAGPQKFRGNPSYIGFLNTSIDRDFRNSLWLHHLRLGTSFKQPYIPRGLFSFNNIHMNIGSVRWYSQVSSETLKSKQKVKGV